MTATANVTMPAGATPPASPRDTRVKKRRRGRFGDRVLPYLLLLPALAAILVLLAWPLVQVLAISFRKLDIGQLVSGKTVWIGFDNYTNTLSDPEFWTVTFRTLVFTAVDRGRHHPRRPAAGGAHAPPRPGRADHRAGDAGARVGDAGDRHDHGVPVDLRRAVRHPQQDPRPARVPQLHRVLVVLQRRQHAVGDRAAHRVAGRAVRDVLAVRGHRRRLARAVRGRRHRRRQRVADLPRGHLARDQADHHAW